MAIKKISYNLFVQMGCLLIGTSIPIVAWANDGRTANENLPAWTAKDIAVIVNDNDPLSSQIANYYQAKRQIPINQIIHVSFESGANTLTEKEFNKVKRQVDKQTPSHVQGYVLTWLLPFRVNCMSITTAFAVGYDKTFCAKGCTETRHNPYYDSSSPKPFDDFGWRPTILLAGKDFTSVQKLIDRGIASDYTNPKGTGYLLKTKDKARSSRAEKFPDIAKVLKGIFPVRYMEANFIEFQKDVMFYFTGMAHVKNIDRNTYLAGAIADHLTSYGGVMSGKSQMSVLEWLDAGVTGSYGTVLEPCNYPAKFSNPGVLMDNYLHGSSLIEAYWKSVAEPGQGVFVGEPLAKPFAIMK
jgi:uncharacterized protein (TIGR03790 family)